MQSTENRTGRAGRHVDIQQIIQQLSQASPDEAAYVALEAFLTPTPSRPPLGERKLQQGAVMGAVCFDSKEVVTYSWGQGPVVLISHGWSGRGTQFSAFVPPLVQAGFRVVAFDAPAHGASPGEQTNILEIATALNAVGQEYGPLHAVIGHSLGAAAILLAESKFNLRADGFVLIGCFAEGHHITEWFGHQLKIPGPILMRMEQLMHDRFDGRLDWENLSVPEMARASQTPILLIHDKDDQEIPYAHAEQISAECTHCQLMLTAGLGHYKILKNEDVVKRTVSFITTV